MAGRCFHNSNAVYVVQYSLDNLESFSRLRFTLDSIQSRWSGAAPPIILVGTKADLCPGELARDIGLDALKSVFPSVRCFFLQKCGAHVYELCVCVWVCLCVVCMFSDFEQERGQGF